VTNIAGRVDDSVRPEVVSDVSDCGNEGGGGGSKVRRRGESSRERGGTETTSGDTRHRDGSFKVSGVDSHCRSESLEPGEVGVVCVDETHPLVEIEVAGEGKHCG